MRMFLRPAQVREAGARIERRLWWHLARHWDGYRQQFAAPMSRCSSTDLGEPFWLEKALGGRLGLANPAQRPQYGDLDAGIHAYQCPADIAPLFLGSRGFFDRELFAIDEQGHPTQGATCVQSAFSLGTVNRGDLWNQRRPLLAYFGGADRPARAVRMRVIRDGYDFASAQLWSVQLDGNILGLINFRSDGGGRHPTLDPIRDGRFRCGRLFLELSFDGLPDGFEIASGADSARVQSSLIHAEFQLRGGCFGDHDLSLASVRTARGATLTSDFKPLNTKPELSWGAVREGWAVFTLQLSAGAISPTDATFVLEHHGGGVRAKWASPAGTLELAGLRAVVPAAEHARAFADRIQGAPVPIVRLQEPSA
jgi:hypothetical protein